MPFSKKSFAKQQLTRRRVSTGPSALITSVEPVFIQNTTTTTVAAITEVDLNKSIIMYNGFNSANVTDDSNDGFSFWKFDSSTQISVNRRADSQFDNYYFNILTFPDDVVKNVSHDTLTHVSGTTTEGTAITDFDIDFSVPIYNGTDSPNAGEANHQTNARLTLEDVSGEPKPVFTVGSSTTSNNEQSYSVIEFEPDAIVSIERFEITLVNGVATDTHDLSETVDTDNSIIFYSGLSSDGVAFQPVRWFTSLELTDGDTVTATRFDSPGQVVISATVVQFVDGVINSKQTFNASPLTSLEVEQAITAVDVDKSFINYLGHQVAGTADFQPRDQQLRLTLNDEITVGIKKRNHLSPDIPEIFYDVIEST